MAHGTESNEIATPRSQIRKPPTSSSSTTVRRQQSIAGFFQKQARPATCTPSNPDAISSSDGAIPSSSLQPPSSSPLDRTLHDDRDKENGKQLASPRRRTKQVNYAESDDENDTLKPSSGNGRAAKRRRVSARDESDDEFGIGAHDEIMMAEELDQVDAPDDSDSDVQPTQRRKRAAKPTGSQRSTNNSPPPVTTQLSEEMPATSTAQQWLFDPLATPSTAPRKQTTATHHKANNSKQKAHKTEPSERHPWLANVLDADRNAPGHPDYDHRTLYIPPHSFKQLSNFEQQYWEIKKKFMDTVVFFKKGKFYELYENDATIGHQEFDLKLTDRVNMRMVGVPESSLDYWANQFVAKGYKIARVDQMETALGKDMRERELKGKKEEKIIRRELASVLTSGTLVDGGMLQDDLATYCAAIKESEVQGKPAFGIAFVDTATAQFSLADFVDDVDMTRFETFMAQIRPGELVLEKSTLSARAMRIIKNNVSPTTIWNYLKPGKEFLSADKTRMTFESEAYFEGRENDDSPWPSALQEAKEKDLVFSAVGALTWYLTLLKIDRDLISCGNFTWYDPIRKATSLVLDGQSLINLEVFANTFDGSKEGTLFTLLNRCVTPFGKRMLRQWVCHPLADPIKIRHRLDAIEALNADTTSMDRFTASLSRLPDLERLISRIHAGRCKPQDFVRVLEGFEQIEYTISLLRSLGEGEGLIGQLITAMPDLNGALDHWKDAFDRTKARDDGLFIPQPGVEQDFDESQENIDSVLKDLDRLLNRARKDLGSSAIKFTDNGKEIYQLEVPLKIKGSIPKNWKQMSATKTCKRWYSPELENLVQSLKEQQETHAQVVKALAGRFFARFDLDYAIYLAAVKIVAQLDCLISLAKVSATMGAPSCRPEFIIDNSVRSTLEFQELRHPCIETTTSFIPNDISLGGFESAITLLTGANAAGKSTVLRMTCVAVILAQIGCYVPCQSARLTPVDRIMSRLGAHDNIFAGQSTFMVELSETKKILSEATPRSLVILDELGRGTSSYDGVAVAQAVLHHVATHVGALGYFATHYHSLATEFQHHPEITAKRMAVKVEHDIRDVTFLYKLETGVAEGSYGMHCAAMCGIPDRVIDGAEIAARNWEHTGKIKESLEKARESSWLPLGLLSDISWLLKSEDEQIPAAFTAKSLEVVRKTIDAL